MEKYSKIIMALHKQNLWLQDRWNECANNVKEQK